jgi:hypothetical protein
MYAKPLIMTVKVTVIPAVTVSITSNVIISKKYNKKKLRRVEMSLHVALQ